MSGKKAFKEMQDKLFDEQKNTFNAKMRENVDAMLYGNKRSIDGLMTDKVSEYFLMAEQPMAINIGGVLFYIKCFSMETEHTFWRDYVAVLAGISGEVAAFDLLSEPNELYKALIAHESLYGSLIDVIGRAIIAEQDMYNETIRGVEKKYEEEIKSARLSLKNARSAGAIKRVEKRMNKIARLIEAERAIHRKELMRHFTKHVSKETLLQICLLVYLYNFDAVKKNLSIILEKMSRTGTSASRTLETYIYSWLQNLDGIMVNFNDVRETNLMRSLSDLGKFDERNI